MKLAASSVKLDVFRERIYLENSEDSAGKFFEYEKWDNSYSSYDDEEWGEEDYDHAELFEDGKLTDCLFDCKDCEGFQSENKGCSARKEKYMEYLLGSESIKEKYWKWKKEEDEGMDDEEKEDGEMSDEEKKLNISLYKQIKENCWKKVEDIGLINEEKEDEGLADEEKEDEGLADDEKEDEGLADEEKEDEGLDDEE